MDPIDTVAEVAETLNNLIAATKVPMPAEFHVKQLVEALIDERDKLREAVYAETGEDPWGVFEKESKPNDR